METIQLNCLHCLHRTDREQSILQEVATQSIPIDLVFHEGILSAKNPKEEITKGHQRIVRQAQEQGLIECHICEDDLVFTHADSLKYYLSQRPQEFDCFFAMTYQVNKQERNRILGDFSGGLTMFTVRQQFYEEFLKIEPNCHLDRKLGSISSRHQFYVAEEVPCIQSGIYSDQLKRSMDYSPYLMGRKIFGRTEYIYKGGVWSS